MAGDNPTEETPGSPEEFLSKSVAQRAAVIIAGPFMNYVLAILFLIGILYFAGTPLYNPDRIVVGEVTADKPASRAGLTSGDIIVAIDGERVSDYDSVRVRINAKVKEPLELTWVHGGDTTTKTIVTTIAQAPRADGGFDTVGVIGFGQKVIGYKKLGLGESIRRGVVTAHVFVYETIKLVKMFVTGEASPKMIGGPLFIAQMSGERAQQGATSLLFFMALLSVNLAVLNVLPIPMLDGGHLCFLAIEKIRGSPLSVKVRTTAQQVGLFLILALILFSTYNDILRVFQG
jgi:regulator of sigma E protease